MFAKRVFTLAVLLAALTPDVVAAQEYPNKPVRLIIPFSPGGTNDVLARMVANHLTETFGQTVVPDNRPGFQGIIGTDMAAKAQPDGYTLAVISSAYTMNPATVKMPFDPITALEFVCKIGQSFLIMTVGPRMSNVRSIDDLLAEAERKPGEIVLSTSGGFMHFATALFTNLSKRKFNVVLYKGGFPAMMDVMGGQVHAGFAVSVPALPHLRAGKLKGLAVGTLQRAELLPDLPTLDEVGVTGFDASNWYAIAVPSGTPRPIVMKLHKAIANFFTSPEMRKKMTAMGAVIDIKTPDEMRTIIPAEIEKWTQVAIEAGLPRKVK